MTRRGVKDAAGLSLTINQSVHEPALPPLKSGTQVLCLLKHFGDKYQIAGWFYGIFAVESGALQPLMARDDFAPEYRGVLLQDAVQAMLGILRGSASKVDIH
jgi:hypothetical protein